MTGWTKDPHQTLPAILTQRLRMMKSTNDPQYKYVLLAAWDAGWGAPALAAAVAGKPGTIHQMINRTRSNRHCTRNGPPDLGDITIPAPRLGRTSHPYNRRLCGPALNRADVALLRRLQRERHVVHYTVRGNHAGYQAAKELASEINRLLQAGHRYPEIIQAMGVARGAIHSLLERFGYRQAPASRTVQIRLHPDLMRLPDVERRIADLQGLVDGSAGDHEAQAALSIVPNSWRGRR